MRHTGQRRSSGGLSILSRPEGRLRFTALGSRCNRTCFQSSAAPKDGCDLVFVVAVDFADLSILSRPEGRLRLDHSAGKPIPNVFQSSAAPKDGCDSMSPSTFTRAFVFQSSAAPKDGCDFMAFCALDSLLIFQSSAAPKDGCDFPQDTSGLYTSDISILSRPEGRLRSGQAAASTPKPTFQSSAAPKDGCDLRAAVRHTARRHFNPQPPRRTAAI